MIVGILGGGQLGRMLALAGVPLGLKFRCLEPAEDAPAAPMARHIVGAYEDPDDQERFARDLRVATYEFENIPAAAVEAIARHVPVYPPVRALEVAQDRLSEKTLFQSLCISVPPFAAVDSADDLKNAVQEIGLPCVLKTRRFGYDGKGQRVLRKPADVDRAWKALGGQPLILEGFVPFDRELSILAVRSVSGETAFYPLVQNTHSGGILRLSLAPAPGLSPALQDLAQDYALRVLQAVDYVGVLAIEFFQVGDSLLANEMAPRVHNSGHWTIEGARCSQFENHLRAILDLPLGSTAVPEPAAMVNLIGTAPDTAAVLRIPGAHLHLYGKKPRPGRKLGHITLTGPDEATVRATLEQVWELAPETMPVLDHRLV